MRPSHEVNRGQIPNPSTGILPSSTSSQREGVVVTVQQPLHRPRENPNPNTHPHPFPSNYQLLVTSPCSSPSSCIFRPHPPDLPPVITYHHPFHPLSIPEPIITYRPIPIASTSAVVPRPYFPPHYHLSLADKRQYPATCSGGTLKYLPVIFNSYWPLSLPPLSTDAAQDTSTVHFSRPFRRYSAAFPGDLL